MGRRTSNVRELAAILIFLAVLVAAVVGVKPGAGAERAKRIGGGKFTEE